MLSAAIWTLVNHTGVAPCKAPSTLSEQSTVNPLPYSYHRPVTVTHPRPWLSLQSRGEHPKQMCLQVPYPCPARASWHGSTRLLRQVICFPSYKQVLILLNIAWASLHPGKFSLRGIRQSTETTATVSHIKYWDKQWLKSSVLSLRGNKQWLQSSVLSLRGNKQWLKSSVLSLRGNKQWLQSSVLSLRGNKQWLQSSVLSLCGNKQWLQSSVLSLRGNKQWLQSPVLSLRGNSGCSHQC